jgi:hypothetical protein
MTLNRPTLLRVLALVAFIVLAVYALIADAPEATTLWAILGIGLALEVASTL